MKNLGFIEMTENELHNVEGSGFFLGYVGGKVIDKLIDYAKDPYVINTGCPDHGDNGPC